MTFKELCNINYLRKEANLALQSSNSKKSSEKEVFIKNPDELLKKLQKTLENETYIYSPLRTKIIYEPKQRKIDIPPFYPDRIYQRAMMDAVSDLFLENFYGYNTFSSIKGQGLLSCKETIESIIKRSPGWYYINIDATKYFEHIDHDILKQKLSYLGMDPKIYKMHCACIDRHFPGVAIGCFPSQYYANLYLSDFDFMMMWMTSGRYVRYMDNCIIWAPTKKEAHQLLDHIRNYFNRFLKLTIKNNWQIAQIERQPLNFCGYVFYKDHTLLRKNIKQNMKKKARKLDKKGVSDKDWKFQMASYYGWAASCSGKNLWKSLKKDRDVIMKKEHVYSNIKSLKEIKDKGEFDLRKSDRVSIESIVGKTILIQGAELSDKYRNGIRLAVKFQEVKEERSDGKIVCGESKYFLTGSAVLKDKILQMKSLFPFTGTILKLDQKFGHGKFFTIQ